MLNAPVRLIFNTFSKSSTVILSMSLSAVMPALLIKISTLPKASVAASIIRFASVASLTSPEIAATLTPYWSKLANTSAETSERPLSTTFAPIAAK